MDMKKQLQRRLVANVLMDKCAAKEHIIFKASLYERMSPYTKRTYLSTEAMCAF